jgi:hypothetical protein
VIKSLAKRVFARLFAFYTEGVLNSLPVLSKGKLSFSDIRFLIVLDSPNIQQISSFYSKNPI